MGSPRFRTVDTGGFLVTQAQFAAGDVLRSHYHDRPTVAVMLEGSFDVVFGGRSLPCPPGALHTEPAEERHENRLGSAGAHVVVIQPDRARAGSLQDATVFEEIHHQRRTPVTALAWRLARELHWRDATSAVVIEGLVLELLARAPGDSADRGGALPPWLRRARDRVHEEFRRPLRVADLAGDAGVHPDHLARTFRARFGTSVGDYLRRLRLDWSAVRLADSDHSITQIALAAGFADQSHFTRTFTRRIGLTPARYRLQARQGSLST